MAAEVDICNAALGHLGDEATVAAITPPDGSVQAGHCARFYPMARDELLERHTWRFNTQRAVLALSPTSPPAGWAFAYAAPSLMRKPIAVLAPDQLPDFIAWWYPNEQTAMQVGSNLTDILNSQDYIVEASPVDGTPIIYTNVEQASLVYSVGVTDTTKFSALFVAALARLLASKLAGPIIKGSTGANVAKAQLSIFEELEFPNATLADANARQANPYTNATPAAIVARY
jgi:hypothetical protein